jgi:hypothetical protein
MYLAPHDAYVRFERDLGEELIPVRFLYDAVQYANNPLNLFIIDACRDNPWTKPLEQFGLISPTKSTPASENVILANSTLSGSKSPDGAGDKSPYAQAFVSSLDQADGTLSDFFGAIGISLRRLRKEHPEMPIPTINQPAGREFVFVPTQATYNREQKVYVTAVQSGNRDLLDDLAWKYSGGYFYRAAKNWLAHAPLAPASSLPSSIIQLQGATELLSGPSAKSAVLETRTAGTRLIATALSEQQQYVAVATGWKQEPAFVKVNQVRLAPLKIDQKSFSLTYKEDSTTSIDLVSDESLSEIKAISSKFSPLVTRVDVVGYVYTGAAPIHRRPLRLLSRQASALEALAAVGYDPIKIAVRKIPTQNTEEDEMVRIQFSGSNLPETGDFQKFNAEIFIKAQQMKPNRYLADGPSSSR